MAEPPATPPHVLPLTRQSRAVSSNPAEARTPPRGDQATLDTYDVCPTRKRSGAALDAPPAPATSASQRPTVPSSDALAMALVPPPSSCRHAQSERPRACPSSRATSTPRLQSRRVRSPQDVATVGPAASSSASVEPGRNRTVGSRREGVEEGVGAGAGRESRRSRDDGVRDHDGAR